MNLATQYAKALHELMAEHPTKGKTFIHNLEATLTRRGHTKLLPQIMREYEREEVGAARVARAKEVTPERERTRVLFELYKKLTALDN
jgi:hypothetical protein